MIVRATSWRTRCREALVASAALLFLAGGSGGCAAAGMAAVSPVLSAIQAVTDRSVERTLPADLHDASAATLDTVSRLGFQIRDLRQADEPWTFQAANEVLAVHGQLTRLSPSLTRLSLRVEVGSLAADKSTADEILNQISASLAEQSRPRASAAVDTGGPTRLSELEAEVQRLRLEVETIRTRTGRTHGRDDVAAPDGGGQRQGPGVISIPASYGIPTTVAPSPPSPQGQIGSARSTTPSVLTVPLAPVNGLRPIPPVTETGSGGK